MKRAIQLLTLSITTFFAVCLIIFFCRGIYDKIPTDGAATSAESGNQEAHYTFDDLLDAIWFIESECGLNSKPGQNGEIGDYQLKKIYVDDFNRIQRLLGYDGEEPYMSYNDRFDEKKSRYATSGLISHYACATWKDSPHTSMQWLETAARAHHRPADRENSKTDAYWLKVKAKMEEK